MNEIFYYFKFQNLSKNWEKYISNWEKWNFESIGNFAHIAEFPALWKPWIFVWKHLYEMKAFNVQVYIQQWLDGEQRLKFM